MHALTNSGAILLAVLLFLLVILLAELSYIFWRRDGSFPDPQSPTSKEMEEAVVAAADKWRVSRLLFTINEEDLEMEANSDDDNDNGDENSGEDDCELRVIEVQVEYSGEPTPFLTPCDSPPYFTPSPSPGRDMDDVINVYDISSRGYYHNFQGSQMC